MSQLAMLANREIGADPARRSAGDRHDPPAGADRARDIRTGHSRAGTSNGGQYPGTRNKRSRRPRPELRTCWWTHP